MTDLAQTLVESQESCCLNAYRDSVGLFTIGWGHLLADQGHDYTGYTWTQDQADAQLEIDMDEARYIAGKFPNFALMNDVRQAVLISMAFQMGSDPLTWPVFNAALTAQNYSAAAAAGLNSLWSAQTPARAQLEMGMLKSGVWS